MKTKRAEGQGGRRGGHCLGEGWLGLTARLQGTRWWQGLFVRVVGMVGLNCADEGPVWDAGCMSVLELAPNLRHVKRAVQARRARRK